MERNTYKAGEGMTYRRKEDGFIMGREIYLGLYHDGTEDTIENYEEVADESVEDVKDIEVRTEARENVHEGYVHPLLRLLKSQEAES